MKKLLALVLALVMTLSLCTVSNAAYSDAADVDYNEAVDVMSAVGVFQGSDGKFSPKAELTREQAAKLIAYLDLGESVAEALPATKVFNDVEANRWSAKYIAYCADAGYLAGVGNGNFDPAGKLTGYAFGKMLLCVLGYDAAIEGFTGANWQIKVATLMQSNDIAKSVDASSSATLTREAAAQYCLNALKATMVEYDDKGMTITGNGLTITTGAKKAAEVTAKNAEKYVAISGEAFAADTAYTVELGEKLYNGDLKVVADTETDAFGRPAVAWNYKNSSDNIGTYGTATPILTYTAPVKGGALYTDLGKVKGTKLDGLTVYVDGKEDSTAKTWVETNVLSGNKEDDLIGNGVLLEVYKVDGDYTFVIVNTYVGYIRDWKAAKLDKNGDVDEKEYVVVDDFAHMSFASNGDQFKTTAFTKQDKTDGTIVLYTAVKDDSDEYTVKSVVAAEAVEDVAVTAYKTSSVTAAGTTYKYSKNEAAPATYTMKDTTYTMYLDNYGYVVYADVYEETASTDYLFVADKSDTAKKVDDFGSDEYYSYKVVDMEGNVSTVKAYTANGAAKNAIVTMKDDTKHDGFVKFTTVESDDGFKSAALNDKLAKTQPAVASGIAANAKTVFVLKEGTSDSSKYKVYTGIANVPGYTSTAMAYAVVKDSYAKVVFINLVGDTADSSAADELIYVFAKSSTSKAYVNDEECYVYDAIVDGVKTTINAAKGDLYTNSTTKLAAAGLVKITQYDADGFVEYVEAVSGAKYGKQTLATAKEVSFSEPTLTVDTTAYLVAGDAVVYMVDADDDLTVGTVEDLVSEKVSGDFYFVYVSDKDATVAEIYFDGTID